MIAIQHSVFNNVRDNYFCIYRPSAHSRKILKGADCLDKNAVLGPTFGFGAYY